MDNRKIRKLALTLALMETMVSTNINESVTKADFNNNGNKYFVKKNEMLIIYM